MDDGEDGLRCPSCGSAMLPHGMPSGEVVRRCPVCGQIAI